MPAQKYVSLMQTLGCYVVKQLNPVSVLYVGLASINSARFIILPARNYKFFKA